MRLTRGTLALLDGHSFCLWVNQVLEGAAGAVPLPKDISSYGGLVAEILGHFGSSEGFVKILRDVGINYRQQVASLRVVVPAVFGTAIVPVCLFNMKQKFTVMCLGPKVALVKNFPFRHASLEVSRVRPTPGSSAYEWGSAHPLPDSHNFMELYESLDIVVGKNLPAGDFTFQSEWVVNEEGYLDAFATYLLYGDSIKGPFATSNQDGGVTSTNWATILIPIPVNRQNFRCLKSDRLRLISSCDLLGSEEPSYKFVVTVESSDGEVRLQKEIAVHYKDLVCKLVTLRNVLDKVQTM